jgi:hypothetical protein
MFGLVKSWKPPILMLINFALARQNLMPQESWKKSKNCLVSDEKGAEKWSAMISQLKLGPDHVWTVQKLEAPNTDVH